MKYSLLRMVNFEQTALRPWNMVPPMSLPHAKPTIVCIDDYGEILRFLRDELERRGYSVYTASDGKQGLEIVANNGIHGVVTDFDMPEMNGAEVAAAVRESHPHIPILMLSGSTPTEQTLNLVDGFLVKGRPMNELANEVALFFEQFLRLNARAAAPE